MRQVEAKTLSTINYTSESCISGKASVLQIQCPTIDNVQDHQVGNAARPIGSVVVSLKKVDSRYDVQKVHLLEPERCLKT
jgi:hypothetical protein